MVKLTHSFNFQVHTSASYSFELTLHNPAGWSFFTPFEVYEEGVLWTASHFSGKLVGIRLSSSGSPDAPTVNANVFSETQLDMKYQDDVRRIVSKALGANQDLSAF